MSELVYRCEACPVGRRNEICMRINNAAGETLSALRAVSRDPISNEGTSIEASDRGEKLRNDAVSLAVRSLGHIGCELTYEQKVENVMDIAVSVYMSKTFKKS